jgi:rubredoxin
VVNEVQQSRECPMCGESMRRQDRIAVIRIPGTSEVKEHTIEEWVCRECDYFEESGAEDEPPPPTRG